MSKATLITKETQISFKLVCLEGNPPVEVQTLTSYIHRINCKSHRLAKHCLFLLFRLFLKKTGLFQEHERRYFNMYNSEVFISRDDFGYFSQSFHEQPANCFDLLVINLNYHLRFASKQLCLSVSLHLNLCSFTPLARQIRIELFFFLFLIKSVFLLK